MSDRTLTQIGLADVLERHERRIRSLERRGNWPGRIVIASDSLSQAGPSWNDGPLDLWDDSVNPINVSLDPGDWGIVAVMSLEHTTGFPGDWVNAAYCEASLSGTGVTSQTASFQWSIGFPNGIRRSVALSAVRKHDAVASVGLGVNFFVEENPGPPNDVFSVRDSLLIAVPL